jgi:hypothetical protein
MTKLMFNTVAGAKVMLDAQGSLLHSSRTHSASYPTGTESSFLGVKWPCREDDQSPPTSAEVKNSEAVPPKPPYIFMVWYLID